MSASSNGPRYAPEDPTLPKPWKGLIDGKTGYLYFWNPETNVTQYERPMAKQSTEQLPPPPPLKSNMMPVSSSVHAQHSSGASRHGQYRDLREEVVRDTGSRSHHHHQRGSSGLHSQSQPNGVVSGGHGRSLSGLSTEAYRRQHEITVLGDDIPAPFMTFESAGFPPEIMREVHHAGFAEPTPIQAQAWPIAMQSRDVVAIAKTGSGKTLGYLFPGFMHLNRLRNNPKVGPTVLVLAPTRELATQILEEALKFGRSSRISSTCLYGGAPKGPQLRDIDRGVDVVVATPGRLNDILEMRRISLKQVSYLVLDEADRMLDMGFEPQIWKIVKEIPPRRQTLMFTATWPKEVRKIAADLLVKPIQVNIGSIDELVANKAITQYVEVITPIEKQRRLEQILRSQEPGSKVLIFCSTKRMCDQLARSLTRQFGASAIHGDKSQNERDYVLGQFRTGRSPILVATDVAARGLDIKDVRVVINYDFPTGIEDYVHRIGRTGRAGATGMSYTFFSEQDSKHASDLIKVLEGAGQRVPRELRGMSSRGGGRGKFRRWASSSGGRDGGRSRDSRVDSNYGGRGERGMPDGDHGGRGGDRDRYDRDRGDARTGRDTKSTRDRDRDVDRGRSRSPITSRGRGGIGSRHSRSRDCVRSPLRRSRSRSHGRQGAAHHSRSRSRDRGRSPARRSSSPARRSRSHSRGHKGAPHRSRSRSRGRGHSPARRSRSRSRSHSHGRGHVGEVLKRDFSPKDARAVPRGQSPADTRATDSNNQPHTHRENQQYSPPVNDNRSPTPMEDRPPAYDRSPTPMDDRPSGYDRSPTPLDEHPTYDHHSATPREDGLQSPSPRENGWGEPAQEPTQEQTRSPLSGDFHDRLNGEMINRHSVSNGADDEEEGMIPADEEGMMPPAGMQE